MDDSVYVKCPEQADHRWNVDWQQAGGVGCCSGGLPVETGFLLGRMKMFERGIVMLYAQLLRLYSNPFRCAL